MSKRLALATVIVKALAPVLRQQFARLAEKDAARDAQVAQLRDDVELLKARTAPSPAPEDADAAVGMRH